MSRVLLGRVQPTKPNAVTVGLIFEPHDLWIGLYWVHDIQGWDGGWWEGWRFYLAPLPTLVLRIDIDRSNQPTRAYRVWKAARA